MDAYPLYGFGIYYVFVLCIDNDIISTNNRFDS